MSESTALATTSTDYSGLTMVVSPGESLKRLQQLQAFVKEVMIEGQDYGTIPGTDKPTLLQPGAQKLGEIYGFAPSFLEVRCVEDWDKPLFHYEVRCVLTSRRDGSFIGDGLGSCNSKEKRYAGRWAFDNEIPAGIAKNTLKRREGKSKKNGRPYVQFFIPNDDIFTLVNTLKKMACKRALVHATIGATRSAGLFTQDMEDIRQESYGKEEPEREPERAEPPKEDPGELHASILKELMGAASAADLAKAKQRIVRARHNKSLPPEAIVELIDAGTRRAGEIKHAEETKSPDGDERAAIQGEAIVELIDAGTRRAGEIKHAEETKSPDGDERAAIQGDANGH